MTDNIYVMSMLCNVSQPFHWANEASDDSIGDTQAPNSISKKIEAENVFYEAIIGEPSGFTRDNLWFLPVC